MKYTALAFCCLAAVNFQAQAVKSSPSIPYWSVWADAQGVTHQTHCALRNLALQDFAHTDHPEWVSQQDHATKRYIFNIMPVGWIGNWHKNPEPQWIIPLSGRWFVKTTDGKTIKMSAGEMSFGGDQLAQMVNGKEGHISGSLGKQPAKVMIIQLKESPENAVHPECAAGGTPIR